MKRQERHLDPKKSWPPPWEETNAFSYLEGNACALYCDADAYFKAFIEAADAAQSHIFVLGWDIHTATNLAPDRENEGNRWSLENFLRHLLKDKPQLQIYILGWDYSPVFMFEREILQRLRFSWEQNPRLHFQLDAHHPLGGSHHQKIVVVDDKIAFLGGLDITIRRWDRAAHLADDPHRKDPDGESYAPFHDLQIGIEGPSTAAISQVFRERWLRATAARIRTAASPHPVHLPEAPAFVRFDRAAVALSRTSPRFRDYHEILEIAGLYTVLLEGAKRSIYIENQYLTSQLIVDILAKIGRRAEGPEIIVVLPKKPGGWLEKKTMGLLQTTALQKIFADDRHGRARVYYPFDQDLQAKELYVTVHSKLLIVDDIFMSVGSANLNNRSMGFDTEINATIDATREPENRAKIKDSLAYFLSHFSNVPPAEVRPWLDSERSLRSVLDRIALASPARHLADFKVSADTEAAWLDAELLDMHHPAPVEIAMDSWARMSDTINRKIGVSPRTMALVITVLAGIGLALLWSFSSLPGNLDVGELQRKLEFLKPGEWTTLFAVPLIYGVAGLLFFPINLLIIVSASLFPMPWAFAYIALGVIANTLTGFLVGRFAGRYFFHQFFGRRTRDVLNRIGDGHFAAIVLVRIVPIAPTSVVNLAAGAGRIPLFKFIAATLVGMSPGTLMLVVFQRSIIDLFRKPTWTTLIVVGFLVVIAFSLYRWSRSRFSNYGRSAR